MAGVLAWWFGVSPAAAEDGTSTDDATGVEESADDSASDSNAVADAIAEIDSELAEVHALLSPAGATNARPAPSLVDVTSGLQSAIANTAPGAMGRVTAPPLLVPVLDAALPPVLAPVVRPVSTTVDAIVTPVVAPVRDTVVTPVVDGVTESVVSPLHEAVTPIVGAVVEPATLLSANAPRITSSAPQPLAEGLGLSADADDLSLTAHEVAVDSQRKSSGEQSGDNRLESEESGQDGAQPSSASPNPAGHSPVQPAAPHPSSTRSTPSGTNGDHLERSQRGLLTARVVAPAATPTRSSQTRATTAGASQNSGSRPAFTPD